MATDTYMNNLTKKFFYSFLTLYLLSSFIFLLTASYWFYLSQVSTQKSNSFYKMTHIADMVSSQVIEAHMHSKPFVLEKFENATVGLYDKDYMMKYGSVIQEVDFSKHHYIYDNVTTLITQGTASHLGISYVVVQSKECGEKIVEIQNSILLTSIIVGIVIIIIAVILSYIFLQPIKNKMQEIEDFVRDTTHELNTPITALMMSTSRAKSKQAYDEKIIKNISISTKQLYDIYSTLSYLSFDVKSEEAENILFNEVVEESIEYFDELLDRKGIKIDFDSDICVVKIAPNKAKMLVNNLISNAIKYSLPDKNIYITTTKDSFSIKDEGIGISKDKLDIIFDRFTRANDYAGGFGLGLNVVESIAKEYGIEIDISSKENVGTTITLRF